MIKKNRIDVLREVPTSQNAEDYFDKTIDLYNRGDYEEALTGFEKLSNFLGSDMEITLIPHMEICKRIKKKTLSNSDMLHFKNQIILQYFGWIDKLKYFTGIASPIFLTFLFSNEENTFSDNLSENPWYLILAIVLAIFTFLLHIFMDKFVVSEGFIRCKYCGVYIYGKYMKHEESPSGATLYDCICNQCNRMNPMPNFYWDGWEGLEYMESRHTVSEEIFYKPFDLLKEKYAKEYETYKLQKAESAKSKSKSKQ